MSLVSIRALHSELRVRVPPRGGGPDRDRPLAFRDASPRLPIGGGAGHELLSGRDAYGSLARVWKTEIVNEPSVNERVACGMNV